MVLCGSFTIASCIHYWNIPSITPVHVNRQIISLSLSHTQSLQFSSLLKGREICACFEENTKALMLSVAFILLLALHNAHRLNKRAVPLGCLKNSSGSQTH